MVQVAALIDPRLLVEVEASRTGGRPGATRSSRASRAAIGYVRLDDSV